MSFVVEIPRRHLACVQCNAAFAPKATCVSLLEPTEKGLLQRHDYCAACWEATPRMASHAYWKWRVPTKEEKKKREQTDSKDGRIWELLQENLQAEAVDWKECFILALYLQRAKLLALRQERITSDNKRQLLYEYLPTEEMVMLQSVDLKELPTQELQERLAHKLRG